MYRRGNKVLDLFVRSPKQSPYIGAAETRQRSRVLHQDTHAWGIEAQRIGVASQMKLYLKYMHVQKLASCSIYSAGRLRYTMQIP